MRFPLPWCRGWFRMLAPSHGSAMQSSCNAKDSRGLPMSHGHGHAVGHEEHEPLEGRNKMIALLISVIALFLAFSETLGKSSQTAALNHQIEASNLWNFFQAKNIRRTT